MKPICIQCRRFFRPKKNGFYFLEGRPLVSDAKPGNDAQWAPCKVWSGDLWRCPGCGAEILSGFGQEAIAEQYQSRFAQYVKELGADQFQVNDC